MVITGVVSFYKDFVESLYELLGGSVSVTGKELVAAYTCSLHVHTQIWTFNFSANGCVFVFIISYWACITYKKGTSHFASISLNSVNIAVYPVIDIASGVSSVYDST